MTSKKPIDIEKLLQWAFIDELSKRQTAVHWDTIANYGALGGRVDEPQLSPQRYAFIGDPHPDAVAVEAAVKALPSFDIAQIDWDLSKANLLGPLLPWAESWIDWRKTLAGCDAAGKVVDVVGLGDPLIGMGEIKASERVRFHAIMRSRPDWERDAPKQSPFTRSSGGHPLVLHRDPEGRYCVGEHPSHRKGTSIRAMIWWPSPTEVIRARVEYAVWWLMIGTLAESLNAGVGLLDHLVYAPLAPEQPWINSQERMIRVFTDDTELRAYHARLLPKARGLARVATAEVA